ncbi:calcium-activated chloride channel regulator 1-like [Ptychodera flava]|uniref:calcium-activated chloride channel regulator 1-like n=1 Tax=Ptychodera flava TaxID=63121 RepID=UPI00396AAED9
MLKSEDFKNDNNPARQVTDTTPTFRVVKIAPLRIVLVLDVSGSMNNRINNLNQMSTKFIMATVPDGHFVGIVLFESEASISAHLTELQGIHVRQSLAESLPNSTSGGTCIGCGLESGIEVLGGNGGIIMLITDGNDGHSEKFQGVKAELIGKGVSVDTVAFGDAADPKLSNLSRDTGGIAFLYNEGTNSTGLNDALSATISSRLGGSQDVSVTVASVRETSPVLGSTFIDESIGLKTLFYFLWTTSPISVVLHRPNGDVIDSLSPNYRKDGGKNLVVIEIDDIAEPGEWFYNISGRPQLVEISVLSSPSDKALPIRVMTSNSGDSLISEKLAMVIIYAQVMQGYRPILNAIVVAIVERPSPYPPVQVKLMDNGAGVDITKDDGVYSGVFIDFVDASCPNCRYSIKIIVRGVNGTATVEAGGKKDGVFPFIREPMDATGNETENVGPFVRVVSGGGFEAPMTVPEGDIMPPSRITDLRVLNVSYDQTVSLSWTAPGNDFDRGAADEYDLRYSGNFSTFSRDFRTGINVPDGNIALNGNLSSPNPFGEQETVLVHMASEEDNSTYFFAIRARDAAGNEGAPSNIASVIFARNQMVTTTSKPSTTERSTTSVLHPATEEVYAPKLHSFNGLAVGCSVVVVLLLLVLVLGIVIVRRKATKGSYTINGEGHQNPSYEMNE